MATGVMRTYTAGGWVDEAPAGAPGAPGTPGAQGPQGPPGPAGADAIGHVVTFQTGSEPPLTGVADGTLWVEYT